MVHMGAFEFFGDPDLDKNQPQARYDTAGYSGYLFTHFLYDMIASVATTNHQRYWKYDILGEICSMIEKR